MYTFNKWYKENYGEIPMNNNKPTLQFTKLTPKDIALNEDLYIDLLAHDKGLSLDEKGKELHEAQQLFYETFK